MGKLPDGGKWEHTQMFSVDSSRYVTTHSQGEN